MRRFILDSLLLFYDAFFRPARLQQRLNEWVPPRKDGENTERWLTILTPTSRQRLRIFALHLSWWLVGVLQLVTFGWDTFSRIALVIIGVMLLLIGWSTSVLSSTLGVIIPTILAIVWVAQPELWELWQPALSSIAGVIRPWLAWRIDRLLLLITAVDVGLGGGGVYWALSKGHRSLAHKVGFSAGIVAGLVVGTLVFGVAGGVVVGAVVGMVISLAFGLFFSFGVLTEAWPDESEDIRVINTFVLAFALAFGYVGIELGKATDVWLIVAAFISAGAVTILRSGGVEYIVLSIVDVVAIAVVIVVVVVIFVVIIAGVVTSIWVGLRTLPSTLAWPTLALIAFALGRRPRWWGALFVAGSLAALRAGHIGWSDTSLVFGLSL
jgi:hypothetical protein